MEDKFRPGDTTDLRGYAIRINQGQVFFFNSDGVLTSCSIKEAEFMNLTDLYRKSINGPWMLRRSYTISGFNNKNAFKTAAAKMRVGKNMSDFYHEAVLECFRQSTKPHKDIINTHTDHTFILDILTPKVKHTKKRVKVTVRFITNPNYNGNMSIEKFIEDNEMIYATAKRQLMNVDEFKGVPFHELPEPTGVSIVSGSIVLTFSSNF